MKIRELADLCYENNDCGCCEYEKYCSQTLPKELENISPYGLLSILDREVKERD